MMSILVTYISVPLPNHFFTVNYYKWNYWVKHILILRLLTNFAILFHSYSYQITQYLFVWILILRYLVQLSAHSGPCLGKRCSIL